MIREQVDITKNSQNEYGLVIDNSALLQTETVEYTTAQSGTVLVTGESGYLTEIRALVITTDGTSGEVKVGFDGGNFIKMYVSKQNQLSVTGINIRGNEGEDLKVWTTTGTDAVFIGVNYIQRKKL